MSRTIVLAAAIAVALGLVPIGAPRAAAAQIGCPTQESARWPIDRVAGRSRYATSACVSQAEFPGPTGGTVVVARGDAAGGWADALAGTVLTHDVDGPLLLTDPTSLPPPIRDELQRLLPTEVLVLGGPGAVSDAVVTEIRRAVPAARVERVAASDRFGTAAEISRRAGASGTAFLVNGYRPADALVAGAPAARDGAALLLVDHSRIPAATIDALADYRRFVIVGGYGVVTERVEDELARRVGRANVRRVSGGTRAETAASVARAFPAGLRTFVVRGSDYSLVDAIGAGWSAARDGGGAVLYAEKSRPGHATDRYLRLGGLSPTTPIRLVGGTGVLSDRLVDVLETRYDEASAGGPRAQTRAVWAHLFDASIKTRPGIDRMLDRAAAANLNTVIVEVVRRQDSYYTSSILPRTTDPELDRDLDVVARLTRAAHDRGLEVHAWVPVLQTWHDEYAKFPRPKNWVYDLHGPNAPLSQRWVTRNANGSWGTYLDPGVPAVSDHVVAVMRELAGRYPVDAVHLDYLRYPGREWGYHPTALALFRQETGATGTPSPGDPAFSDWRRAQTRRIARRVAAAVRAENPDVAISVAGSTMGEGPRTTTSYSNTRTWNDVFQTWPDWLRDGTVDAAYPMNYFRETDATQRTWFDEWVAFERELARTCTRDQGCVVAVGQGAYLNPPSGSFAQIQQGLRATGGAVVYSYQQDAVAGHRRGALLDVLVTSLFRDPAPAPDLR